MRCSARKESEMSNKNFYVIYYLKDGKVNVPIAVSISNDLFNIMFPQKSFIDKLKKEAPDGSDIFINIINVGIYLLKTNY